MQNNFTSLNGSIHSLFNQRFSFKHLGVLVASVLSIVCAVWLPYALFWQLDGLLNLRQAQIIGSTMFYGGIASFIVVAVVTRFRLSKTWSLKRNVGLFSILLSTTLVFSSLLSAPVVAALTPLPSDSGPNGSSAYKFSIPFTPYEWFIGQFRDGSYYAVNGSDWNIMTIVEPWQPVAPWASLSTNLTALTERCLSVTSSGVIFLKQVPFDLALMNSIPPNVKVACSYQDQYCEYINSADSSGSPYTVEVGAGLNNGYYIAKDSENRICFTSLDADELINSVTSISESIILNPGVYSDIDSPIRVKGTFAGTDRNSTILKAAKGYTGDVLQTYYFNQDMGKLATSLNGFTVDGSDTATGIRGVFIEESKISDLSVINTKGDGGLVLESFGGLALDNRSAALVCDNFFRRNLNNSIVVKAPDNRIENNIIAVIGGYGIWNDNVGNTHIIGNHIYGAGYAAYHNLTLTKGIYVTRYANNLEISLNMLENLDTEAICFAADGTMKHYNQISNNLIWAVGRAANNTYSAIAGFEINTQRNIISGNTIWEFLLPGQDKIFYKYAIDWRSTQTGAGNVDHIYGNTLGSGATGVIWCYDMEYYSPLSHINIHDNVGFTTTEMSAGTFTADGSKVNFTINHGLTGGRQGVAFISVQPNNANTPTNFYVTTTSTSFTIHYLTPPPAGDLSFKWWLTSNVHGS